MSLRVSSSSSSTSKADKKWDWKMNPFKTFKRHSTKSNAAEKALSLKKQESERSVTSFLSPTSVETESPFSLPGSSPGKEIKLTVKPVAPNLEDSQSSLCFVAKEHCEEEEEPKPCIELKKQEYQDDSSSPTDDISKYGYGCEEDSAPHNTACENIITGCQSSPTSQRASLSIETTSRRSSLKKVGSQRRASIQFSGEIENVLPSSNGQKVKRRTSVQFNEKVKVKSIAPIKTMDDVQPETLWFQEHEYKKMKEKCHAIVDKVDYGDAGGKKYCTRGLEGLSMTSQPETQRRKFDAWDTVLDEQDRQFDSGQFDEEYIAKMYKFTTFQNQKEANRRANQDQIEVEAYLKSVRKACRRFSIA